MRTIYAEPLPAHRVLVLGGGFAGVSTVQALERRLGRRRDVEVWLVNEENFTLFTPLLPEVCSGVLEPRHVVTPLRGMVRHDSTWCITATVEEIDLDGRVVTVMGGDGEPHRLRYDTLVLALGGETATFGIPGLAEHAVGMKTLADAFSLRNRLIEMLERAELEDDPAERAALLTFVVGGAGFSGVETAGEIEDFLRRVRRRYYPAVADGEVTGYLVELKDAVLPEMPRDMGDYAARRLARRGYRILLGTAIRESPRRRSSSATTGVRSRRAPSSGPAACVPIRWSGRRAWRSTAPGAPSRGPRWRPATPAYMPSATAR